MDPLVSVLAHLRVRGSVSSALEVHGECWRLGFEAPRGWKFNAVRTGDCLLVVEGAPAVRLSAGDCFLLTSDRPFELADDERAPRSEAAPLFERAAGGTATFEARSGDADFRAIGGSFEFSGSASRLSDALPAVLVVPGSSAAARSVQETLTTIDEELVGRRPGAALVAEHLAVVMLVQVLRWWVEHESPRGDWFAGLVDPVAGPAIAAIHEDAARAWSVADLARTAAVSRSTMAERFRHVTGVSPMDYLVSWRMELAAHELAEGTSSVAAIGRAVGYHSESAFCTAFKRVRGRTPGQERAAARRGSGGVDFITTL